MINWPAKTRHPMRFCEICGKGMGEMSLEAYQAANCLCSECLEIYGDEELDNDISKES